MQECESRVLGCAKATTFGDDDFGLVLLCDPSEPLGLPCGKEPNEPAAMGSGHQR